MQKLLIALLASHAAAAKTSSQCVPGDLLQMRCKGSATYTVKFTGTWTDTTHPVDYPVDAHWSPLVGATHAPFDAFWYRKGMATPGIQEVAETGNPGPLVGELDNAMYLSSARAAGPVFQRDETTEMMIELTADAMHDQLTAISMVAPSPNWYSGVASVDLCDHDTGEWKTDITMDLKVYDAGTDRGMTFTAANDAIPSAEHKIIKTVKCRGYAFCGELGDESPPEVTGVATLEVMVK